jgi:hypothetical protein
LQAVTGWRRASRHVRCTRHSSIIAASDSPGSNESALHRHRHRALVGSSSEGAPPPTGPDGLASVGFLKDVQVASLRRRVPLRRGGQRFPYIRGRGGPGRYRQTRTASRIAGRPASRRAEPHGAATGRGPEPARASCLRRTAMPQGVAR